jgi:D-alanyl-D-alanine carboxypeptidase
MLRRALLASLVLSLLGACGGGGDGGSAPLASAADLVQQAGHPGAVTVEVSSTNVRIAVAGSAAPQRPLRDTDWLPVGSLSKPVTATLAALLVQDGRLRWDSKLLDLLPELRTDARADYANVTLRDLLAHRGGVFPAVTPQEIGQLPDVTGTLPEQRLQLARWALQRAPSAAPTQAVQYSNGGYLVAAAMIERAGGAAYEALLQTRLLQPLGIQARFGAAGAAADEAQGHVVDGNRWRAMPATDPASQFPAFANPAGGLKLPPAGIARFLQMHLRALRGATGEPISPDTARTLHQAVQADHALGWFAGVDLQSRPLSFHAGSDDHSYYALAAVSRAADTASFAFVNGWQPRSEAQLSEVAARLLK